MILSIWKIFLFFSLNSFCEKKERFSRMFFFLLINESIQFRYSYQIERDFRNFSGKKILFLKKSIWMCFAWHENQKKMSSEICWSSEINKINKSRCKTATIDHLNGFLPIYPESWFYWNEILIPNQMYRMYQFWHNQRCTLISGFIELNMLDYFIINKQKYQWIGAALERNN